MLDEALKNRNRTILVIVTLIITLVSWLGVIDSAAAQYVNSATVQALAAFTSARGINAIVTLLGSLEVSVSFLGGFGIQPFQILDPVNDLVEQYSALMKYAIGSLVIQKVLIEIVSTTVFKVVLTVFAAGLIAALHLRNEGHTRLMMKLFLMAALIRLLVVLVVLLNGMVDRAFVNDQTEQNMAAVSEAALEADRTGLSSAITDTERESVLGDIVQLELEKAALSKAIEARSASLSVAQTIMDESQEALRNLEVSMSTLERHNRLSRSPEHQALIDASATHRSTVAGLKRELERDAKQLERLEKDLVVAHQILNGEQEESGFAGMVSSVRNMANVGALKIKLENAIVSMLNLMALFVLKTLIMPLIFLGLLLKGFKGIWGVDPRVWVVQEMREVRQSA